MHERLGSVAAVAFALASLAVAVRAAPGKEQPSAPAEYAGSSVCADCHDDAWASFRKSVHYQTLGKDFAVGGCESCHGPGAEHVASDGETPMPLFDDRAEDATAADRIEACMECHAGSENSFDFRSGEHMKGGIDCAACHETHQAAGQDKLLAGKSHELCLGCHQEIRTSTALNERHRILEGMVDCTDCHDPHGRSDRTRLGGVKQENCFECHTDKQGPFVFEHGSVRVEGCTSCHSPHGSVNRHMLAYQQTADLCFSCHAGVPGFHTRFQATTNCTNCHTEIHGSNLDPYFLR